MGLMSPRLQKAILQKRMQAKAERLVAAELPLAWVDQEALLE